MKVFRWKGTSRMSGDRVANDVLVYFGKHKARFHCQHTEHATRLMDALCEHDTRPTLICRAAEATT